MPGNMAKIVREIQRQILFNSQLFPTITPENKPSYCNPRETLKEEGPESGQREEAGGRAGAGPGPSRRQRGLGMFGGRGSGGRGEGGDFENMKGNVSGPCFPQTITNKYIEWDKIPWEPQNYLATCFSPRAGALQTGGNEAKWRRAGC